MNSEAILFEQSVLLEKQALSELRDNLSDLTERFNIEKQRSLQVTTTVHELLINLKMHPKIKPSQVVIQVTQTTDGVLLCKVKDNGSPFTEFERKLRAATISDEGQEGGYGLYILKEYFKYIAYSEKKRGSFEFNQLSFAISEDKPFQFNKPRLALIDDDNVIVSLISSCLKKDYLIETFRSGEEFIAVENKRKFSLILCDISLPGIDGFSVRSNIASSNKTDMIPFIFITSRADSFSINLANSLGIDDYVVKPFKRKELLLVIRRVLKRNYSQKKVMLNVLDEKLTSVLRPSVPSKVRKLRCCAWSESASSGGGDFLIHLKAPDSDFIILGDVMGHGTSAKFYAHMYAAYIRSILRTSIDFFHENLGLMLSKASNLICIDEALDSVIATMVCLKISHDGSIFIANAGHPPPLLYDKQSLHEIPVKGSLLGLTEEQSYELLELRLKKGQKLILYTDGLEEAGVDNQEREKNKKILHSLILSKSEEKLSTLSDSLHIKFQELCDSSPFDDTTMVFLELASAKLEDGEKL